MTLCPMTKDGAHKRLPWSAPAAVEGWRSGLACVRCHQSWRFVGTELVSVYEAPAKAD